MMDDFQLPIDHTSRPKRMAPLAACIVSGLLLSIAVVCSSVRVRGATSLQAPQPATPQASTPQAGGAIQGKLSVGADGSVKIAGPAGPATVTSANPALSQTLQDSRLNGREVKLEGERKPDGSFEARHLFTVRDGKLFRVRFYCHVCNIPAIQPGNCVCCQRPTELDEIPADEVTDDMVMVP